MYRRILKPFFDFLLSLIGLILLLPVFLIIMVALFFANNGKPFFLQARPGKNEKIFKVIKFKTMNDKKDAEGNLLPDDVRLTKIGKFIRKTSLDELPQLINVLKGEMSLIGPRPFMSEYLEIYNDFQNRRHEIKPGITGWAQVNGRDELSIPKKVELDFEYLQCHSLIFDVRILWLTFVKVVGRHGVSH